MSILFNRAVLLAKLESTFGTNPGGLAVGTDGFLVEEPNFVPDITTLERQNVKTDLSPDPVRVGRKLAQVTFRHEVRGPGSVVSALGQANEPLLGRLLRACAMKPELRAATPAATIGYARDTTGGGAADALEDLLDRAHMNSSAYTGSVPRIAKITVTDDAGGDIEFDVTIPALSDLAAITNAGQTLTGGTGTITLGAGAAVEVTSAWSATTGDTFEIDLLPAGVLYKPTSDNSTVGAGEETVNGERFDSLSMELYLDGLKHELTGARGTWSLEASANDYARFSFTFTGNYVDPTDAAQPAANFPAEQLQAPDPVEYANLHVRAVAGALGESDSPADSDYTRTLKAQQFTIDIGNNVVPDEDINAQDSFVGAIITDRSPSASMNPETVLEATFDFWAKLKAGTQLGWGARVGVTGGNVVVFDLPNFQIANMGYENRNEVRVYNLEMNPARDQGDDEIVVAFY